MTDFHEYNTPEKGVQDWHIPLNENFRQIDSDIEIRGPENERAEYTPKTDTKYLSTDTGRVFIGDGTAWNTIDSTGKEPIFSSIEYQSEDGSTYQYELIETHTSGSDSPLDYSYSGVTEFDVLEFEMFFSDPTDELNSLDIVGIGEGIKSGKTSDLSGLLTLLVIPTKFDSEEGQGGKVAVKASTIDIEVGSNYGYPVDEDAITFVIHGDQPDPIEAKISAFGRKIGF